MKKDFLILSFIIFLCWSLPIGCGQLRGIPEEIKRYVFERSEFSRPITLNLPPGDSPNKRDEIVKLWKESQNATLMPLIFYGGKSLNIDTNIMNFLAKNNYAKKETMTLNIRNTPTQFTFIYYLNNLTQYIIGRGDSGIEIILAKRKLKSIGYINNYRANILGVNVKVCAFTFKYFLETKLPGLPKLNKEFEGQTKAYLDPDDGKWKVENVVLSDRGDQEYLNFLTQELIIDSRKMQHNFKASNLSYQYGQGSLSLIFNIEGGVPPYNYEWPTINGSPANNLLSAYRVASQGYSGPLYRIDFQDVKESSGAITIAMDNEFQGFGWPPDLSFPLNINIKIVDASSPPKVATLSTVLNTGPKIPPTWRNEILGFNYWIEKHGRRMDSSHKTTCQSAVTPSGQEQQQRTREGRASLPLWINKLVDSAIIPGRGLAGITLGEHENSVIQKLGKPDKFLPVNNVQGDLLYYVLNYNYQGIMLVININKYAQIVNSIRISDTGFNSSGLIPPSTRGPTIGSLEKELYQFYGRPLKTNVHATCPAPDHRATQFSYKGISFCICRYCDNYKIYWIDISN